MFVDKSILVGAAAVLSLAAQASGHAIPVPALGVAQPQRKDTQRPTDQKPCGNIDIASNLDKSVATPVNADGTVTIKVENSNAGKDGATAVKKVLVDATGTGKNFVAGTVKTNGNPSPTSKSEQDPVTIALPPGTKCTGGASKNLCLVSITTNAGFGACTVVSQGGAGSAPPAAAPPAAPPANQANPPANQGANQGTNKNNQPANNGGKKMTKKTKGKNKGKKQNKNKKGKGKGKKGKGKKGNKKAKKNAKPKGTVGATDNNGETIKLSRREEEIAELVRRVVVEELAAELAARELYLD